MPRLVFVGTGSALPTRTRTNTMLAIVNDEQHATLLIDCGSGVFGSLLRAGIDPKSVTDLYITHAHIDHIGDLPSLIESMRIIGRRDTPLRIWALAPVLDVAKRLLDLFSYELTLDDWPFPIELNAVDDGQELTLVGLPVRVAFMEHALPSAGLRFHLAGGDVGYTSDTQPNQKIVPTFEGVRLLITECTHDEAETWLARRALHMTAREAGEVAESCGAKMLALVHLGVGDSEADHFTPGQAVEQAASSFSGEVFAAFDGQSLEI